MALIKRKTRRKLSKQLSKILKKHGTEVTMALVGGIVGQLSGEDTKRPRSRKALAQEPVVVKPPLRARAVRKRPTL